VQIILGIRAKLPLSSCPCSIMAVHQRRTLVIPVRFGVGALWMNMKGIEDDV
jgi:hypothetical protein